jgi:uncharacterized protein YlxW (UPF0749 family)
MKGYDCHTTGGGFERVSARCGDGKTA